MIAGELPRRAGVPGVEGWQSKKPCTGWGAGLFGCNSLTMTYFHTGCSTIIGAKSFHGPVRDGKGWYQLAMVIRHDLSVARDAGNPIRKKWRFA